VESFNNFHDDSVWTKPGLEVNEPEPGGPSQNFSGPGLKSMARAQVWRSR